MNTVALESCPVPFPAAAFDWAQFALYGLVVLGVAYVVGYSQITYAARSWLAKSSPVGGWLVDLLQCPKCLGFHVGWSWALAGYGPFAPMRLGWIIGAWATAALMLIADRFDFFDHAQRREFADRRAQTDHDRALTELGEIAARNARSAEAHAKVTEAIEGMDRLSRLFDNTSRKSNPGEPS